MVEQFHQHNKISFQKAIDFLFGQLEPMTYNLDIHMTLYLIERKIQSVQSYEQECKPPPKS